MEEHLHTQLRWPKEAPGEPPRGGDPYTAALPLDIQVQGVMHSPNGVEEGMQTRVHFEVC